MLLILLVVAFILFVLAGLQISARVSLGWFGLACLTAYWLLARVIV